MIFRYLFVYIIVTLLHALRSMVKSIRFPCWIIYLWFGSLNWKLSADENKFKQWLTNCDKTLNTRKKRMDRISKCQLIVWKHNYYSSKNHRFKNNEKEAARAANVLHFINNRNNNNKNTTVKSSWHLCEVSAWAWPRYSLNLHATTTATNTGIAWIEIRSSLHRNWP